MPLTIRKNDAFQRYLFSNKDENNIKTSKNDSPFLKNIKLNKPRHWRHYFSPEEIENAIIKIEEKNEVEESKIKSESESSE